jgi:hypothetical protein
MNLKIKDVVTAYNAFASAKITSLDKEERKKVFALLKPMVRIHKEYQEFVEMTDGKLKPENWEELIAIETDIRASKATIEQAKQYMAVGIYRTRLNEALVEEGNREVEIDAEPIEEAIIDKIFDENKWNVGQRFDVEPIIK